MSPPPTVSLVNPLTGNPLPQQAAYTGPESIIRSGSQAACATGGGPIVVRTPVGPVLGAVFGLFDADGVAATNNITLNPDDPIDGSAAPIVFDTNNANAVFVFEGTQWRRLTALRRFSGLFPPASNLIEFIADNPFGGGGGGGGSAFSAAQVIWRPGVPSAGSAVATWAEVATQIAAAQGQITVLIDPSTAPCVVPAGPPVECFGKVRFGSFTIPQQFFTMADGAQLKNVGSVVLVNIGAEPTAISPFLYDQAGAVGLLSFAAAFVLGAGATVPFIRAESPQFIFTLFGSGLDNMAVPALPVVDLIAPSNMFFVTTFSVNPAFNANAIRGAAPSSLSWAHDPTDVIAPTALFTGTFGELRTSKGAGFNWSSGNTASRPPSPVTGELYFDTDLASAIIWDGAAWGGVAALIFDTTLAAVNVRIPRLTNPGTIDNTKQGITNLGSETGPGLGAKNDFATIGGGIDNTAAGTNSTVAGGTTNAIDAASGTSTISGGGSNSITGAVESVIGGGTNNSCLANQTTVGGGNDNNATGPGATVSGGEFGTASGSHATVSGGNGGTASGDNATVVGGLNCQARGAGSTVGGTNCTAAEGATAFGDTCSASSGAGTGAVAIGVNCTANGNASVALGNSATALGSFSCAISGTTGADRAWAFQGNASGSGSWATGINATSPRFGQESRAQNGTTQRCNIALEATSALGAPTDMTFSGDPGGGEIALEDGKTYSLTASFFGSRVDAQGCASVKREYLVHTTGGAAVIDAAADIVALPNGEAWTWVASTPGGLTLRFTFTGSLLQTVDGAAHLEWRELVGA